MNDNQRIEHVGRELLRIWEDQQAFNTLFRQPPGTVAEMTKQARDFVLYTEDELHELLRIFKWKEHRRGGAKENLAHMDDELADIFKCALSLFQICGMTPERLIAAYWRKTAVVNQRYQEEWVKSVTGDCAVVDIDQVLCNYVGGICQWLRKQPETVDLRDRIDVIERTGNWINGQELGMEESRWQELKHRFRVSGAKRELPVFADAARFLDHLRERRMQIVLLTSRPIDRYPNIQTDTLLWLQEHGLSFDFLWWSFDKIERILDSNFRSHVRLVVDDDPRHLAGFAKMGIRCFLLRRDAQSVSPEQITGMQLVSTLDEIRFTQ